MMSNFTIFAVLDERVFYEFSRVALMDQWWHWFVLLLALILLTSVVITIYRRDGCELPRGISGLLLMLRLAVVAMLVLFFLGPEKRSEKRVVKTSRTIVAIDTSQSMALRDVADGGDENRIESVARELPELVQHLRQQHDVLAYRFDEDERPQQIAMFPKQSTSPESEPQPTQHLATDEELGRSTAYVALILLCVALVAFLVRVMLMLQSYDSNRWMVFLAGACLLAGLVTWAVGDVRFHESFWSVFPETLRPVSSHRGDTTMDRASQLANDSEPTVDWTSSLALKGTRTRIGDALLALIDRERGGPISGICIITDGNQNQGAPLREAIHAASDAHIPILPIGIGSDQSPVNVRVAEVEAPSRVYPGDAFKVRVFVQGTGMSGQSIRVELLEEAAGGDANEESLQPLDEEIVRLTSDNEPTVVEFTMKPPTPGRHGLVARVTPPAEDSDPLDNQRRATVTVIDRRNRVLLMAGGPTREYQFLRVLLYRDPEVSVDVYLQPSAGQAAQEADEVLATFPSSLGELSQYDCIVAFDPDWTLLSDEQVEALDRWVAEQAGGLILVAGPVFTPEWSTAVRESRTIRTIKQLYPVTFPRRGGMVGRGQFQGEVAQHVDFTPEGLQQRFLWLADDASASQAIWNQFSGIYGTPAVLSVKPGATVLAASGDERSATDARRVFLASQFYGAGRVLYLGSGELWRLRALEPDYFDLLYTRMIRYVSEGRLLLDSSRGMLLVDRDRCLIGESVQVRALLRDSQFQPLNEPRVNVDLKMPSGRTETIVLLAVQDAPRGGTYAGQFVAREPGDYRLHLALASGHGFDFLQRDVNVRMPDFEMEAPQRNDQILAELASDTGGTYFRGFDDVAQHGQFSSLLLPRGQETYVPGAPDRDFRLRLLRWFMLILCGTLSWEWLVRRWHRLA